MCDNFLCPIKRGISVVLVLVMVLLLSSCSVSVLKEKPKNYEIREDTIKLFNNGQYQLVQQLDGNNKESYKLWSGESNKYINSEITGYYEDKDTEKFYFLGTKGITVISSITAFTSTYKYVWVPRWIEIEKILSDEPPTYSTSKYTIASFANDRFQIIHQSDDSPMTYFVDCEKSEILNSEITKYYDDVQNNTLYVQGEEGTTVVNYKDISIKTEKWVIVNGAEWIDVK